LIAWINGRHITHKILEDFVIFFLPRWLPKKLRHFLRVCGIDSLVSFTLFSVALLRNFRWAGLMDEIVLYGAGLFVKAATHSGYTFHGMKYVQITDEVTVSDRVRVLGLQNAAEVIPGCLA
jgi:hypothetical protein